MLIHRSPLEIEDLRLVGSPWKFSETPVGYKLPPPGLRERAREVLERLLGYSVDIIQELFNNQVIS
jgi:crotonobetainyl-CoA:carnitine CoA-transferase CaiB-like acyl-CoA transferase